MNAAFLSRLTTMVDNVKKHFKEDNPHWEKKVKLEK